MNIVKKSRTTLIRGAKVIPFVLCFIVLLSYCETIYALAAEHYCVIYNSLTLDKPISFFIGRYFVYNWESVAVLVILSISVKTCIWNKACLVYLSINVFERSYFVSVELYPVYIYSICIANAIVALVLIYGGFKQLS